MDEKAAVAALAALAQEARLRVFRALVGAGPEGMTPTALSALLDIPASTLSFHLKELVHAGLVSATVATCTTARRSRAWTTCWPT